MRSKSIKVLGRTIKIRYVTQRELDRDHMDESGESAYGDYNSATSSIRISKDLPEDQQAYTLAHELQHALYDISGMRELLSPQLEELGCRVSEEWAKIARWVRS